jgi:protein-S-isoprenylcysteine O-methyltransferase Ste14
VGKKLGVERIKHGIIKVAGYLVFLVQSVPVWTGLMTLPFAVSIITILTNIRLNLPIALREFFSPFLIPEKALIIIGLLSIIYSIIHLQRRKRRGLVTSGPYGLVRHPQYLGMILTTLGFTSWSIWWLKNTFGIGFLNPSQTTMLFFFELFAYIFLANFEERYLIGNYGESYLDYRSRVPFLIPFLRTENKIQETIFTVIIHSIALLVLIWIN